MSGSGQSLAAAARAGYAPPEQKSKQKASGDAKCACMVSGTAHWPPAAAVPVWAGFPVRWHGQRAERHAAFPAINGEPDYQDAQSGNYEHAYRTLSTGECLLCIEELSAKARPSWCRPDGINEALAITRKIAAVAVPAMENHGVIPR
jgi:hypothetical protein